MDSSDPPADGHRVDDALARARRHAAACAAAIEALAEVQPGNARAPTGEMIVETTQAAAREALLRREAVLGDLLTDLGR